MRFTYSHSTPMLLATVHAIERAENITLH